MNKNSGKKLSVFLIISLLVSELFFSSILPTMASPSDPTKAELEQQLQQIETQIAAYEQELATTKTQKTTLANQIKSLKIEQARLRLQIKSTTLLINDLSGKLTTTQNAINVGIVKITQLHGQIGQLFKLLHQQDDESLLFSLFSKNGLADTFIAVEDYDKLSTALNDVVAQTKLVEADLAKKKSDYNAEQDDAKNLLNLKSVQQTELVSHIGEQAQLLQETQGKESNYQALLSDSQKQAAAIRNRIYQLLGEAQQISFGQAVDIATGVGKTVNVPPAFLLAILTQESNLGASIGTCNRAGDPPEKSWRVIMKPDRDQTPFLSITSDLGRNPDTTPVSCPLKDRNGNQVGWGGAMGPAQFIPSTWMGYKNQVASMNGKTLADPWDIRDAFTAAAIKLQADGADATDNGEWTAAMRYFSGSTNVRYRFYGDNVLKLTKKYESDIADLNK